MAPALGQLAVPAALNRPLHAQQAGQLLLGGSPLQGYAAVAAQLAGATGAGKAFAQLPSGSGRLEVHCNFRQAAVQA